MSRVGKKPIELPKGVELSVKANVVTVKGAKGSLSHTLHDAVEVKVEGNVITFAPRAGFEKANVQAGTARALVNNLVTGVSQGFTRKLNLVGVGFRAAVQGKNLNLTLGFSHPVVFEIPDGLTVTCPTQTEILVAGTDKQMVGQAAANIRGFRPPEPYQGKGVRYDNEVVVLKEAKKK
ncbi:50S ribosomal protein L6 [Permianibacter sp. IMCC34836]|uniref:50S ribosomal protein L6 n=1 Tax=Permianibacter fluminis TaxID=2738515 RepID=UPI001552AFAB|nr:50S ribosomal protein L6 [Permianibacter fluminis]NQD38425.1 50S ribosomal protein L6 [Permianibacter fluminis]